MRVAVCLFSSLFGALCGWLAGPTAGVIIVGLFGGQGFDEGAVRLAATAGFALLGLAVGWVVVGPRRLNGRPMRLPRKVLRLLARVLLPPVLIFGSPVFAVILTLAVAGTVMIANPPNVPDWVAVPITFLPFGIAFLGSLAGGFVSPGGTARRVTAALIGGVFGLVAYVVLIGVVTEVINRLGLFQ
jgi:hypothetical protein